MGVIHNSWTKFGALLSAALAVAMGALGSDAARASRTSPCPGASLSPSPTDGAAIDAATVCLIDQVRATYHLRPLRRNHYLQSVAASQVTQMMRRDYFADIRPSGQTPLALIASTRYAVHAHISAGQNLGWGTGSDATPLSMVAAWMQSPPHRMIMLSDAYQNIGVGVAPALPSALGHGRRGAIYAVEFGARMLAGRALSPTSEIASVSSVNARAGSRAAARAARNSTGLRAGL